MMFPKRTSKGCHQSDQRWNCFRGSTGKTERQGGAHIVDFLECIDTRLNWSEPNWTYKCCGSLSSRQLHTNFRGWIYSSPCHPGSCIPTSGVEYILAPCHSGSCIPTSGVEYILAPCHSGSYIPTSGVEYILALYIGMNSEALLLES